MYWYTDALPGALDWRGVPAVTTVTLARPAKPDGVPPGT